MGYIILFKGGIIRDVCSFIVKDESYLLECARYIERNPVRAKIVKEPSDYLWSSYNHYAQGAKDELITINP
jgi:putative transposase